MDYSEDGGSTWEGLKDLRLDFFHVMAQSREGGKIWLEGYNGDVATLDILV